MENCQHENYSIYECPKCHHVSCYECAQNNRAESPSPERAYFLCPNCGWNLDSFDENEIACISTTKDDELYYKYGGQISRQNVDLILNLEERILKAEIDYNIGNSIDGRQYHGLDLTWTIPPLKIKSLKELMNRIKELCIVILNDSEVRHDGSNFRGYLGDDAQEANDQIQNIIDDFEGYEWEVWEAGDWFSQDSDFEENSGISRTTTDFELEKMAEKLESEARDDHDIGLENTIDYLENYRDELRDNFYHDLECDGGDELICSHCQYPFCGVCVEKIEGDYFCPICGGDVNEYFGGE